MNLWLVSAGRANSRVLMLITGVTPIEVKKKKVVRAVTRIGCLFILFAFCLLGAISGLIEGKYNIFEALGFILFGPILIFTILRFIDWLFSGK